MLYLNNAITFSQMKCMGLMSKKKCMGPSEQTMHACEFEIIQRYKFNI